MKTTKLLHVLRNPYGRSDEERKQDRLVAADEIERYEKIIGRVTKKCNEEMKWAQDNIDEINLPTPHEYQDGESHSYQEGDLADLLRYLKEYKEIIALLEEVLIR